MDEDTFAPSLPEQFVCIVGAHGEASNANGLGGEWMKFQPKFKQHLDAWKQCGNAGDKLKIVLYVPFQILNLKFKNLFLR